MKSLSRVRLSVTPWTVAYQAPLSMGFSRQEVQVQSLVSELRSHVPESEVAHSCPTLCDCSPPGSSLHGILQARVLEWVAISLSRGSSRSREDPRSPELQADALTSEPPGKPLTCLVVKKPKCKTEAIL